MSSFDPSLSGASGGSSNSVPGNTTPAPKRDKFASLAARQQQQQQQQPSGSTPVPSSSKPTTIAPSVPAANVVAPKRAAGGDKFARLASTTSTTVAVTKKSAAELRQEELRKRKAALRKSIDQQQSVIQDMEQAEGMTWNLIRIAKETADSLTHLRGTMEGGEDASQHISTLSKEYRSTLQSIYGLLKPHAHLVRAYQPQSSSSNNNSNNKRPLHSDADNVGENSTKKRSVEKNAEDTASTLPPNMYAARVEMRLALEKQKVLQALLALEDETEQSS